MAIRLQTSAEQRRILEQTEIKSVEDLIYADLRGAGWGKSDAFYAAYRHIFAGYTIKQQNEFAKKLENDPAIQKRISKFRGDDENISPEELSKETSKEKILSDLVIARRRMREGTKEWADITKMIADYSKIKQDDIKTDEQPIRYYLPVRYPTSCKDCLLKLKK